MYEIKYLIRGEWKTLSYSEDETELYSMVKFYKRIYKGYKFEIYKKEKRIFYINEDKDFEFILEKIKNFKK